MPTGPTGRAPAPIHVRRGVCREGGEGPTPYEVLLHAAMVGEATRFTRQDGVEETWRIMQPLLDAPPPVHAYAPGSWGPAEADALVAGHGRWHGPVDRAMSKPSEVTDGTAAERGGAVAVHADRGLRVPLQLPHGRARRTRRRRSTGSACRASTRRASSAACSTGGPGRSGWRRSASTHPTARVYVPGTNVIETTWKTPNGWIVVRTR